MHICSVCKTQVPTAKGLKIHFGRLHKNKTDSSRIQSPPLPPDPVPPDPSNRSSQVHPDASNVTSNSMTSSPLLITATPLPITDILITPTEPRFLCPVCKQGFNSKRGLQTHLRSHPVQANLTRLANQHNALQSVQQILSPEPRTDLSVQCNEWQRKFQTILNDMQNFSFDHFDQLLTSLSKFLFEANERLPGPQHPATKMYRMRKAEKTTNTGAQFKNSTNPKRVDAKARQKRRERYDYELAQWLYRNQRRKVVNKVMASNSSKPKQCSIPITSLEQHYKAILSAPNDRILDYYPTSQINENIIVTVQEVKSAIMAIRLDTAAGYDRVLARTIRELNMAETIKAIIDIMLNTGTVPSAFKRGKTILIYKDGDPNDPRNWRPITIFSILRRITEKVLDRHLRDQVNLNSNQRGFVRGLQGCHVNAALINAVLSKSKNENNDCAVIFIDISKAFDNIGHAHIERCLSSLGISKNLHTLIMAMITDNTIQISTGTKNSSPLTIARSVPQGGPMSPILFNIAINHIYEEICDCQFSGQYGFRLFQDLEPITLTGFADDQVVTSGSVDNALRITEQTQMLFTQIGLEVNPRKSMAIVIKEGSLVPGNLALSNGSTINCINENDRIKYLGCTFTTEIVFDSSIVGKLTDQMNRLIVSPLLKPDQKLNIINEYIFPTLAYPLQAAPLNKIPKLDIETLDLNIRSTAKAIIGLPSSTCTNMIYAPRKYRGLGVVRCSWEMYLQHFAISKKMSTVPEVAFHRVHNCSEEMEACKTALGVDGQTARQLRKAMRVNAFDSWTTLRYQGSGVKHFQTFPKANSFMYDKKFLSNSEWVAALKLNSNYANLRGVPGIASSHESSIRCRHCHNENNREVPSHVLGSCPFGELRRNARHHNVKHKLNQMLQEKGFTCFDEVTCASEDGTNRRIDILAFEPNSTKAYLIDPTIRYESGEDMDHLVQEEKASIYNQCFKDLSYKYKEYGAREYEVIGIWFGGRGTIGSSALAFFERFGLDKKVLPEITESILAASIQMIHAHIYT